MNSTDYPWMVELGVNLLHFHILIFSFLLNIMSTYYFMQAGIKKILSFLLEDS